MIKYLQRRYALSRKGAIDNIKGILCCALQNISFMLPVGLLYRLVSDIMNGTLTTGRIPFYVIGCVAAALFIVVCTRLEYDNTFLVTYVESGVRRVGLAEKLRKIPLSFFGRKDLADLTSSIMNDCAVLEQSQSHFVAPLYGAILSTTVIAVSMLFFNWRMALAAVWPLPVAFAIVLLASDVQKKLSRKATAAKVACEDGIQECMEAMPDLRANNAEERYLSGLEKKIRAIESRLVRSELGTAVFVVSAGLVLRLGIATTALAGAALLVKGELDVLTFFNIILFSLFGWLYMNGLTEPSLTEALITGAIWAGICIVFDAFGWVLIKHPWSLSFKEFYVDYQPWITLIYIAIFAGPLVGYWFALI